MKLVNFLSQIIASAKKVSIVDANGTVSKVNVVTLVDVLRVAEQYVEDEESETKSTRPKRSRAGLRSLGVGIGPTETSVPKINTKK